MLTRREFLHLAWAGVLTTATGVAGKAAARFMQAPARLGQFGSRFVIGPLAALPPAGSDPLNQATGRFWLVRSEQGSIMALHKACTHLECLCEWDAAAREYRCPCHGSRFAITGQHIAGPAPRGLDSFPVEVVNAAGEVVMATDAQAKELPLILVDAAPDLAVVVDTSRLIRGQARQG